MQLKIEKLVYGGEGMGHADGVAVFVPCVLAGVVPWWRVSAVGRVTVGSLEMSLMNSAMTTSAPVVTTASSHSIRRWRRRRLRRRAAILV